MLKQREVLDFCNRVRQAGGANILNDLLPGIPLDSSACLIAHNLNFDCEITPQGGSHSDYNGWVMKIRGSEAEEIEQIANDISNEMDMAIVNEGISFSGSRFFHLKLPSELAEVAAKFDNVWEGYEGYCQGFPNESKNDYARNLPEDQAWLLELSSSELN